MNTNNPYGVLEVPFDATDEEIRKNFHKKLLQNPDDDQLTTAYHKICSESQRKKHRYLDPFGYMHPPLEAKPEPKQEICVSEIEALALELAFLSDWELGSDGQ